MTRVCVSVGFGAAALTCLIPASFSATTDSILIRMEAVDANGKSLDPSTSFFYSVAHALSPTTSGTVPVLKKHSGSEPIYFGEADGADSRSYIGAYVPSGYVARYRYRKMSVKSGACVPISGVPSSAWAYYTSPRPDPAATVPLQLGGSVGNLPALQAGECMDIEWRVNKIPGFNGNTAGLYETPTASSGGLSNMPETKSIQGQAQTADGGGIYLGVSEDYGAVAHTLKINSGSGAPISILHNLGAPTDDGLVWGTAVKGAVGLYPTGQSTDFGASQFCGHPNDGTTFGATKWGLKTPLIKKGGGVHYQSLEMDNSACGGESCYVPMYSDFTTVTNSAGGTLPFMLPSSVHPWDARIAEIAIGNLVTKDGTPSGVERLRYSFEYRPHFSFSASYLFPHLWFDQALTEDQPHGTFIWHPMDIYLVRQDNSSTKLSWADLSNPDASLAWADFCKDQSTTPHCAPNPKPDGDVTCRCSYENSEIKRIVFNYTDSNVALSLQGSGRAFTKLFIGRTFPVHVKARPGILLSVGNFFTKDAMTFDSMTGQIIDDDYFFNVGTLENLDKMGLGR